MKPRKTIRAATATVLSALLVLPLFGCSNQQSYENLLSTHSPLSNETNCASVQTSASSFEKSDIDTYIVLNDKNTVIKGNGVSFKDCVITINQPGTYSIKGKLSDGQIYVDSLNENKKVCLYLDGVDIFCSKGAPIHIESSPKETRVILADDSFNKLSDNADRETPQEVNKSFATATLYSRDDLRIEGNGTLSIEANYAKGIFSRDDIKILSGNYIITSADDAIRGKDSVEIQGGTFDLTSGADAIRTSNEATGKGNIIISGGNITAKSALDTIQAVGSLAISGGCFNLESGGGFSEEIAFGNMSEGFLSFDQAVLTEESDNISAKGIKANGPIAISGGKFNLNCLDDALHGNSDFAISGGTFKIKTNDDAVHSSKTLAIASGTFNIENSYEGIEAQVVAISGGKFNIVSSDDAINASPESSDDLSLSAARPNPPADMPQAPDSKQPHEKDMPPMQEGEEGKAFKFKRGDKKDFGGHMDKYDESCKINISGGKITINSGGDGIDSNGDISMTGGEVIVSGSVDGGNSAIDYSGNFTMNGGTLAATGNARMAQGISKGTISSVVANCSINEGDKIKISDSKGNEIFTFTAAKNANHLVFADKKLVSSESYTVYADNVKLGTYNVTYNV